MIFDLKLYLSYKDVEVPWLRMVPEHWVAVPVKRAFSIQLGKMLQPVPKSPRDMKIPYLKAIHVQWFKVEMDELPTMWASPDEVKDYSVAPGDLLVCEGGEGGRCAIVDHVEGAVILQNALHRVRPKHGASNKFLAYVLESISSIGWLDVLMEKATISHFTRERFAVLEIPRPPLPEQRAIVKFIDWTDRRIRLIIAARKKRIQLLEEYRQTLTNDAVTGKFDVRTGKPYPAYKDSGVEWLGKVPEGWTVRRLKSIVRNINEQTSAVEATTQNLLLSLEHVEGWSGKIRPSTQKQGKPFEGQGKRFLANDILFGKLRPYLAKVARPQRPGICVTEFLVLRPINGIEPAYLEKLLRSHCVIDLINSSTYGAKMPRAEWDFIGSIFLPLPPFTEQRAIAEYLNRQTKKVDAAIEKTKKSIELWEELRATLIADVVTGKLDVREVAEGLPEEEPELTAKIEAFEASLRVNEVGVDEGAAEGEAETLEVTA